MKGKLAGPDRVAFEKQLTGRNIEQVLSRLRRIAGLDSGTDTIGGLDAKQADSLDLAICRAIVGALEPKPTTMKPMDDLAAWIARADYHLPVELFTVNYDLLLETALEVLGVPYFDGFVGTLRARFRTELVEAGPGTPNGVPSQFVRLWKLHGSVNWERTPNTIVRLGGAVVGSLPAAIYPSDAKYEESRRVPFLVLQDRFRRALCHPETLVLIVGYSFSDQHLNEMIYDAATRCQRSEFVVFNYDDFPVNLAQRAMKTPNLQVVGRTEGIIGGERRAWKDPGSTVPNIWVDGKCALPDFAHLASYLARSSSRDPDPVDPLKPGLSASALGGGHA